MQFIFQLRHAIQRNYSSTTAPTTKMFIDGKFVESKATEWIDLPNPATNEVVTRVPKCTQSEMEQAVESSKRAYKVEFIVSTGVNRNRISTDTRNSFSHGAKHRF